MPSALSRRAHATLTTYRLTGTRIAIGQDVRVERDEEVTDAAVVIGGSLTVDGRVRDGVVVVGGDLHLAPTADVRGDIVLVGGQLHARRRRAQVGSINYVSFGDWSRRAFGWLPRFDFGGFGPLAQPGRHPRARLGAGGADGADAASSPARRWRASAGPRRPSRCARSSSASPPRSSSCRSWSPRRSALAITIVGIPFVAILVPMAIVIAVFALVLGYTALACRIGEWLEDRLGWQPGNAFRATAWASS